MNPIVEKIIDLARDWVDEAVNEVLINERGGYNPEPLVAEKALRAAIEQALILKDAEILGIKTLLESKERSLGQGDAVVCDCSQGQVCHICDPITPNQQPKQEPVMLVPQQPVNGYGPKIATQVSGFDAPQPQPKQAAPEQQEPVAEIYRRQLEVIAVGDSTEPAKDAGEVLVETGFWDSVPDTTPQP